MIGIHDNCIELYCNEKYIDKIKKLNIDKKIIDEYVNYINYIANRENKLK